MRRIIGILVSLIILFPLPSFALDASFIISDAELEDFSSMTLSGIQHFLEGKKSNLAYVIERDADGRNRRVSEIIWRASRTYRINPKVLIVLLQKEQSVIEDGDPSARQLDWATGYAVCDDCSTADPALSKFKGFGPQVDRAAARLRYYIENVNRESWIKRAGESYTIDSSVIIPKSNATAFLYTYTPHLKGNINFARVWSAYFGKVYPDGTLLKDAATDELWRIENGARRRISSPAVLASRFDPSRVLEVAPADIAGYPEGDPFRFANYSLLRDSGGTVYLIVGNAKHPLAGARTLKTLGYNPEEIDDVADADLAEFTDGSFITVASAYPQGAVLKAKKSGKLFYVENGYKHPIADPAIAEANYRRQKPVVVLDKELNMYPTKDPVRFVDGTIVGNKKTKEYFLISNGLRRPISLSAMHDLGLKEKTVIWTTSEALALHDLGDFIVTPSSPQLAQNP